MFFTPFEKPGTVLFAREMLLVARAFTGVLTFPVKVTRDGTAGFAVVKTWNEPGCPSFRSKKVEPDGTVHFLVVEI